MRLKNVYVGIACLVFGLSITGCSTASPKSTTEKAPAETVAVPVETETIEINKETAPVTAAPQSTYMNNEYYDVIEASAYNDSLGHTVMIHKVLAKQDVSVTGTVIAYEDDRSTVIDKSTDDIVLTAGQYNFFRYSFDSDVTDSPIQPGSQVQQDSVMVGERNAVEMVTYNQNERHLYITFKQNTDKLGSFAKFKLLFYKDDKIVDTEDGYFTTYAKNLNGNGSSDVVKLRDCSEEYDRFEYIFEP